VATVKTKKIITSAIAFAAGFGAYALLHAVAWSSAPNTIAEHWRVVKGYRAYVCNPANYRPDPQTGHSVTTPPSDPLPSLAALVAAGELQYVDLVFPVVPKNRRTTRYWMQWAENNEDVLHATGNPQYVDFELSGDQPLHLQLWFRESAKTDVQQLIKDLEALARDDKTASSLIPMGGVSRKNAAPEVPPHPLLARYLGEWQVKGETVLAIATSSGGTVTIQSKQSPPWESVINNVRWEGDELRYDEYNYYTGPEDFTTVSNPTGEHPYSGVKNEMRLMLTDRPNRLKQSVTTIHTPQPIEDVLTRAPDGG